MKGEKKVYSCNLHSESLSPQKQSGSRVEIIKLPVPAFPQPHPAEVTNDLSEPRRSPANLGRPWIYQQPQVPLSGPTISSEMLHPSARVPLSPTSSLAFSFLLALHRTLTGWSPKLAHAFSLCPPITVWGHSQTSLLQAEVDLNFCLHSNFFRYQSGPKSSP